ncbi:hypothetical protein VTJ04DRAFT_5732 [Mycothermus thermophilus]|uniref:uncharacterized protein n=1 Tax=Humicola insolens TaxID=85995 RepID=UPI0037449E47
MGWSNAVCLLFGLTRGQSRAFQTCTARRSTIRSRTACTEWIRGDGTHNGILPAPPTKTSRKPPLDLRPSAAESYLHVMRNLPAASINPNINTIIQSYPSPLDPSNDDDDNDDDEPQRRAINTSCPPRHAITTHPPSPTADRERKPKKTRQDDAPTLAKPHPSPPAQSPPGAQPEPPRAQPLPVHHDLGARLLGLGRLQRARLHHRRASPARVHGRPATAAQGAEYHQLPLESVRQEVDSTRKEEMKGVRVMRLSTTYWAL